jgi:hypothetical protein
MLLEISAFGRNHMADTMVLHSHSPSHIVIVFLPSIVSPCSYFLEQNAAIQKGSVKGEVIKLKVLGIGDGLTVWRSGMTR